MKKIPFIVLSITILFLTITCTYSPARPMTNSYTDPAQLMSLPFGTHSHWLQPWRAYLETVPANSFVDGIGINWNIYSRAHPELIAQMLIRHGIRRARLEISWNHLDFDDETKLNPRSAFIFRKHLLVFKKYGIRPLILLNSNHGAPCPLKYSQRLVVTNARAGDTTINLNDTRGLKIDYSGLSNLTDQGKASYPLITKISGNSITLSKALPVNIRAGTPISITTLKYRPFSVPGSEDYLKTMAGWKRYVGTIAEFVTDVLGTSQSADKGFDLEIWNELSFGSDFLYINSYYPHKPLPKYQYDQDSIWSNLIQETAAYVEANSTNFQGVLLSNGLANTIPWPASSQNPLRVRALSKHPYYGSRHFFYPQYEPRHTTPVNALYQKDQSGFVPTYKALFPEYFATALQTETIIRDLAPLTSDIYGTKHGRYARSNDGVIVANPVWITEINTNPAEVNPSITSEKALALKAKTIARTLCFYLNKGATQVHLFASIAGGDRNMSIIQQNFVEYAQQPGAVYPIDDTSYTSPGLAIIGRMVDKMNEERDPNLISPRSLQVISISDTHNHYQFLGDGTTAHPTLYDRNVFAFLPFQLNSRRFVIPYYVMTRDVTKDLPLEQFTVQIKGIKGDGASVNVYDPLNDRTIPVTVIGRSSDSLSLKLTATDYPYLLTVEE